MRRLIAALALMLATLAAPLAAGPAMAATAHAFDFVSIEGRPMPLSGFKGKVVLVVNTASLCGFTPQYKGLQALWERYRDRGLVVLGVPSNDFGGQEPGSEASIKEFCEVNFAVDFPMTEKAVVKGDAAHPFYRWAAAAKGEPKWNFHKYLVGPDGALLAAFGSRTGPDSAELVAAIDGALAK